MSQPASKRSKKRSIEEISGYNRVEPLFMPSVKRRRTNYGDFEKHKRVVVPAKITLLPPRKKLRMLKGTMPAPRKYRSYSR